MRVILPFVLNGQTLEKGKGFPKKVVAGSKDCLVVKVSGIPDGSVATAYFKQSWDNEKVYDLPFVGDECVIDEYITTMPTVVNEYVDYVVSFSVAVFDGDGQRLTTDPFKIVLNKSNYSDTTENTPDIPESQYVQFTRAFADLKNSFNELEEKFDDLSNGVSKSDVVYNKPTGTNLLDYDAVTVFTEEADMWDETPRTLITGYIPVQAGDVLSYQQTPDDVGSVVLTAGVVLNAYYYDSKWNELENESITTATFTVPDIDGVAYVRLILTGERNGLVWNPDGNLLEGIVRGAAAVDFAEFASVPYIRTDYLPDGVGGTDDAVLYTEQTLTEEQKAQARENIGAVSEDEAFDRAIGEITVGKNLLNLNAVAPDPDDPYSGGFLRGKLFNDAGVISGNAAACITDYIPVQDGKYIVCSYNNGTKRAYMMARRTMGYDANKNIIGLLSSSTNYITPAKLAGVAYVRLQLTTSHVGAEGQVEYNDKETYSDTYEPYTETIIPGGLTLKPECMPTEFDELTASTLATDKARFDSRFNYVAYSAINSIGKDQNSREFFLWASKKEFTALKGDIEVTADGKLVMCHDEGFTFDEDGKIVVPYDPAKGTAIHDLTEAECLALQYARYSGYVCSFEEYIRICKKYGKIAYITVRNHYVDEYVPELLRVLHKYGMVKQCIISAYPYIDPLYAVREADPNIMMAWVLGKYANITTAHIDTAISLGNMLICGFHIASASDDVDARLAGSVSAIEYAHGHDVRVYDCQIHTMEQADKLMEYGITGAQIMFAPTFE